MCQRVEAVINHPQGVAQILLAIFTTRQVGEIGCYPRAVGGVVMLIKGNAFDGKLKLGIHGSRYPDVWKPLSAATARQGF